MFGTQFQISCGAWVEWLKTAGHIQTHVPTSLMAPLSNKLHKTKGLESFCITHTSLDRPFLMQ